MKTAKERPVKAPPKLPPPPANQIPDIHNDLGWLGSRRQSRIAAEEADRNLEALGFPMHEDESEGQSVPPEPRPLPEPPPQEPDHDQRGPRPESRPGVPAEDTDR